MKKYLKYVVGIAFTLIVAPVLGSFFVELARQVGLYDDPQGKLGAALSLILSSKLYLVFFGGVVGGSIVAVFSLITMGAKDDPNLLKLPEQKDLEFEIFALNKSFEKVTDRNFNKETVSIDGKMFERCTFRNVTLEFNASKPFGFNSCEFFEGFHISTRNRYAERMIALLNAFGWLSAPALDNGEKIPPAVQQEKPNSTV